MIVRLATLSCCSVLTQQYPNTPGLAIKDYWKLDDNSIVMIVDKGNKGTVRPRPPLPPPPLTIPRMSSHDPTHLASRHGGGAVTPLGSPAARAERTQPPAPPARPQANMLNFNVAENLKLQLPNSFWTRLQNTFGNSFFYRENGDDVPIIRAVDTIDFCLREEYGCVDVPDNFKKGEAAEAFRF